MVCKWSVDRLNQSVGYRRWPIRVQVIVCATAVTCNRMIVGHRRWLIKGQSGIVSHLNLFGNDLFDFVGHRKFLICRKARTNCWRLVLRWSLIFGYHRWPVGEPRPMVDHCRYHIKKRIPIISHRRWPVAEERETRIVGHSKLLLDRQNRLLTRRFNVKRKEISKTTNIQTTPIRTGLLDTA